MTRIAVFGDEEARALGDRTQTTLAFLGMVLLLVLVAAVLLFAELAEELLQRMIIGKVVEAAAEAEAFIFVGGNRVDAGFDTNGNHGRGNGVDDVGEARNLRSLDGNGFGMGGVDRDGDPGRKHGCGKTGDCGSLQSAAAGQPILNILEHCALPFFSIVRL